MTLEFDLSQIIMEVEEMTELDKEIANSQNYRYLDMVERFNTEFTDPDTGLLNISKYDHERIINFFNNEIK